MKTEIILSHDEIMAKVREIAAELDVEYADKNPIMVGIMKGSLYFLSDLTKEMSIPLQIDVMNLSSYGDSSKSSGVVKIVKDLDMDITNRHVVVLEDIVDTGTTLKYLKQYFMDKNAASVKTISIFQKEGTNVTDSTADRIGFTLPDYFLIGYGLDYAQNGRSFKDVHKVISLEEN